MELEETWFGQAFEETFAKATDDAGKVTEVVQDVIDVLTLLHNVPLAERIGSLTAFRVIELFYGAMAIQRDLLSGGYHSAIREMRYFLEAMVHAVAVDKESAGTVQSMMEGARAAPWKLKIHLDKLQRSHGLAQEDSAQIRRLWGELSAHSHPTWAELQPVLHEGRIDYRLVPSYDPGMLSVSTRLFLQTISSIRCLVLLRFPGVAREKSDSALP